MEKRIKIVVGINTLTSIGHHEYSNHCQMWYRFGRHPFYQNFDFILNHPLRQSIDMMRNTTAKIAIENDADYILFIDDDVLVPWECLELLFKADKDIAAGWTIIRGYPFENMFFKWVDEAKSGQLDKIKDPIINEEGLIECDAVGFSCCLIKVSLLKKLSPPFFVTGPYNTEDVYFCIKAQRAVPETTCVVHPGVITSHCMGPEYVSPENKAALLTYYDTMYPSFKEQVRPPIAPKEKVETYEDVLKEAVNR